MKTKIQILILISIFVMSCSEKASRLDTIIKPSTVDVSTIDPVINFNLVTSEGSFLPPRAPTGKQAVIGSDVKIYIGTWGSELFCRYYVATLKDAITPTDTEEVLQLICTTDSASVIKGGSSDTYADFSAPLPETFCSKPKSSVRFPTAETTETVQVFKTCEEIQDMTCSLTKYFEGDVRGREEFTRSSRTEFSCLKGTDIFSGGSPVVTIDTGDGTGVKPEVEKEDLSLMKITQDENIFRELSPVPPAILPQGANLTNVKVKLADWEEMACIYYQGEYTKASASEVTFQNLICSQGSYVEGITYPGVDLAVYKTPLDHCQKTGFQDQITSQGDTNRYERIYSCTIAGLDNCKLTEVYSNVITSSSQFQSRSMNCHNGEQLPDSDSITITQNEKTSLSELTVLRPLLDSVDSSLVDNYLPQRQKLTYQAFDGTSGAPKVSYGLWGDLTCFLYEGEYEDENEIPLEFKSFQHLSCAQEASNSVLNYPIISLEDYQSPREHCVLSDHKDKFSVQQDATTAYTREYTSCDIAGFPDANEKSSCSVLETYDAPIQGLSEPSSTSVDCYNSNELPRPQKLTITKTAISSEIDEAEKEKEKILYRGDVKAAEARFFLWDDLYCHHYKGPVTQDGVSRDVNHLECSLAREYNGVKYHNEFIDYVGIDSICTNKTADYQLRVSSSAGNQQVATEVHNYKTFTCPIEGFAQACEYQTVNTQAGVAITRQLSCSDGKDKELFNSEKSEQGIRIIELAQVIEQFESSDSTDSLGALYKCSEEGFQGTKCTEDVKIAIWNDYYCRYTETKDVDGNPVIRTLKNLYCSSERLQTGENFQALENVMSIDSLCTKRTSFKRYRQREEDRTDVAFSCDALQGLECKLSLSFATGLNPNDPVDYASATSKELKCSNYSESDDYESASRPLFVNFYDAEDDNKNKPSTEHNFFYEGELRESENNILPDTISGRRPIFYSDEGKVQYDLSESFKSLNYVLKLDVKNGSLRIDKTQEADPFKLRLIWRLKRKGSNRYVEANEQPIFDKISKREVSNLDPEDLDRLVPSYFMPDSDRLPRVNGVDGVGGFKDISNIHRYNGNWDGFDCHYTEYDGWKATSETSPSPNNTPETFKDLVCFSNQAQRYFSSRGSYELVAARDADNAGLLPYRNVKLNKGLSKEDIISCGLNIPIVEDHAYLPQARMAVLDSDYKKTVRFQLNDIYASLIRDRIEAIELLEENNKLEGSGVALRSGEGLLKETSIPGHLPVHLDRMCIKDKDPYSDCIQIRKPEAYIKDYEGQIKGLEGEIAGLEAAITAKEEEIEGLKRNDPPVSADVIEAEGKRRDDLELAKATKEGLLIIAQEQLVREQTAQGQIESLTQEIEDIYEVWIANRPIQVEGEGVPPKNAHKLQRIVKTEPGISLDGDCATTELKGHFAAKEYRAVDWVSISGICNERIETKVRQIRKSLKDSRLTPRDRDIPARFCLMDVNETALVSETTTVYQCRKINDMECTLEKTYEGQPNSGVDAAGLQSLQDRNPTNIQQGQQRQIDENSQNKGSDLNTDTTNLDKPAGTGDLLYRVLKCSNTKVSADNSSVDPGF